MLLTIQSISGESGEAWRTVLDNLIKRGLQQPEFLIVTARRARHGHRICSDRVRSSAAPSTSTGTFRTAPERLRDEVTADYNDMIFAATRQRSRRAARSSSANGRSNAAPWPTAWRKRIPPLHLRPASAEPMARAGHARTTNGSEQLHEGSSEGSRRSPYCILRRRSMLFSALLASGQINIGKTNRCRPRHESH